MHKIFFYILQFKNIFQILLTSLFFPKKIFIMIKQANVKKSLIKWILKEGRKEGNVLLNSAFNTFYLWLYGVSEYWNYIYLEQSWSLQNSRPFHQQGTFLVWHQMPCDILS